MDEVKEYLGHHLEWVIMWTTKDGRRIPVAAFKLRSDAELFFKHSDLNDRMEVIYTGEN